MPLSTEDRKIYKLLEKLGFSSESIGLALSGAGYILDEIKPSNATDNIVVFKCYLTSALLVEANLVHELTYMLFHKTSKNTRDRANISKEIGRFNRDVLTVYLEKKYESNFFEGESKTIPIVMNATEKNFFGGHLEKVSNDNLIDAVKDNARRCKNRANRRAKESV